MSRNRNLANWSNFGASLLSSASATAARDTIGAPPAGVVLPFAGTAAPTGWLLCAGGAVSRTTYADLFTAIGTTYGAGNGTTTFNLPDLRGRVAAGKDDMGGSAASRLTAGGSGVAGSTLGGSGGAETHTLTIAQMPSHTHTMASRNDRNTAAGGSENVSIAGGPATATTNAQGSGNAHNNTQPTIILNYIIRT